MSTKWLIGFSMLFAIGTVMSLIIEHDYVGSGEVGALWTIITAFKGLEFSNPITAVWDIVVGMWLIVKALFIMFTWDYSFLTGEWAILKYIIFWPISLGVIISLLLAVRGTASA